MTADAVIVPGGPSARNWSTVSRPRSHRMTAGERVVQRPPATTSSSGVIDAVIRISPGRHRGTSASARAETRPSTRPRAAGATRATMGSRLVRSSRACAVTVRPSSRRPWPVAESPIAGNSSAAVRSRSRHTDVEAARPERDAAERDVAEADRRGGGHRPPLCAGSEVGLTGPLQGEAAGSARSFSSTTGPRFPSADPLPPQSQVPRSASGLPWTRLVRRWISTRSASSTTAAWRSSIGASGKATRGASSVPVHREKLSLLARR